MIGMTFAAFLALLSIGFLSSIFLHAVVRYRILSGVDGFFSKWVAAWIGGWLGTPVLGHWGLPFANLYLIPAVIGAFAAPFMLTACFKAFAQIFASPQGSVVSRLSAPLQTEMRKAS